MESNWFWKGDRGTFQRHQLIRNWATVAKNWHSKLGNQYKRLTALTRGATRLSWPRGGRGAVLYMYSNHREVTSRDAPPPWSDILIPQSCTPFVTHTVTSGTSVSSEYFSIVARIAFYNVKIKRALFSNKDNAIRQSTRRMHRLSGY